MSRHQTLPDLDLDRTIPVFCDAVVSEAILWAAPAAGHARHWRTSFRFDGVRTNTIKYEGISVDIVQSPTHEHYDPAIDGPESFYGTVYFKSRAVDYLYSAQADAETFVLAFEKQTVTVQDIMDMIKKRELQLYKFNPEKGSGCLFWQLTLLEELVKMGWVKNASLNGVKDKVKELAMRSQSQGCRKQVGYVPWPIVQGTFYKLA